jgi:hypothetical protein
MIIEDSDIVSVCSVRDCAIRFLNSYQTAVSGLRETRAP